MKSSHPIARCVEVCLRRLVCLAMFAAAAPSLAQESFLSLIQSDADQDSDDYLKSKSMMEIRKDIVPSAVDGRIILPALKAVSTATDEVGSGDSVGRTPTEFRGSAQRPMQPLPEDSSGRGLNWDWTVSNWAAANTFSHPRYFEDRMLERHGHERCPRLQPFASGMRFFTTVPMLPYLMTVSNPCDYEYTLGYYRSGSCTPAFLQRPPYERRAVIVESGSVAGAIIGFP